MAHSANTADTRNRKTQIVEQAASLFKQYGYKATTMRMLAGHLGIEASSLYHHISSKEEVLREICFTVADQFNAHLQALQRQAPAPSEALEAIIRFHIFQLLHRHNDVYVSNRDWKHLKEPWLKKFLQLRRQYVAQLAQIVEQGIANGSFRQVHPQVAVLSLLSALRSIENWHRSQFSISGKQLTEDLVTLLLKGLATTNE